MSISNGGLPVGCLVIFLRDICENMMSCVAYNGSGNPWTVHWFNRRFVKKNLADEGLGKNPTDRGRSGSKLHLLVDLIGIPLGIAMVGANVHDSRLVGSTLDIVVVERP